MALLRALIAVTAVAAPSLGQQLRAPQLSVAKAKLPGVGGTVLSAPETSRALLTPRARRNPNWPEDVTARSRFKLKGFDQGLRKTLGVGGFNNVPIPMWRERGLRPVKERQWTRKKKGPIWARTARKWAPRRQDFINYMQNRSMWSFPEQGEYKPGAIFKFYEERLAEKRAKKQIWYDTVYRPAELKYQKEAFGKLAAQYGYPESWVQEQIDLATARKAEWASKSTSRWRRGVAPFDKPSSEITPALSEYASGETIGFAVMFAFAGGTGLVALLAATFKRESVPATTLLC